MTQSLGEDTQSPKIRGKMSKIQSNIINGIKNQEYHNWNQKDSHRILTPI